MSLLGKPNPPKPNREEIAAKFEKVYLKDKYLDYWREVCLCGETRSWHGPTGATMSDGTCQKQVHSGRTVPHFCPAFRSAGYRLAIPVPEGKKSA